MLSVLDERNRSYTDGADGFISKPLDRDRVMEVINEIDARRNERAKRVS